MNKSFDFNAPQYYDFSVQSEGTECSDNYFDTDHEIEIPYQEDHKVTADEQIRLMENTSNISFHSLLWEEESVKSDKEDIESSRSSDCFIVETKMQENEYRENNASINIQNETVSSTVCSSDGAEEAQLPEILEINPVPLRKSLSMGNVSKLKHFSDTNIDGYLCAAMKSLEMSAKKKPRTTSASSLSSSNENIISNRKQWKSRENVSRSETPDVAPRRFVSMAEVVRNFQKNTPQRFHSRSKNSVATPLKSQQRLTCTIPQSPMLCSKTRTRPVTYVSHEKQEEIEADKIRNYHFKPQPLNPKIFSTPNIIKKMDGKDAFKIKKCAPKKAVDKLPAVCEGATSGSLQIRSVEMRHDGVKKGISKSVQSKTGTTLVPFSFEKRNKLMLQQKQEKIKKILEEEKKAREFHAKPLPRCIKTTSNESLSKSCNDENANPNLTMFKAQPASVLHKKPFVPKKAEKPLVEIQEFSLSSTLRAKEREEFEKMKKEKEAHIEACRKEHTAKIQKLEEELVAKIRRGTVHKANPIRHYKPLEIQPSTKQLTAPESPIPTTKRK